jgi:molecular chaperone GrpE
VGPTTGVDSDILVWELFMEVKKVKKSSGKEAPDQGDLLQQLAEAQEALLRERADAANVRRRAEEDKLRLGSFYKATVIKELLPFIDNLDRAINHAPNVESKEWQDWFKGIEGVKKQLDDGLAKLGVEKIKTVGETFDPRVHDAISHEEGDGSEEIVSEELQSGYKSGDDVIRPAMVRVKG